MKYKQSFIGIGWAIFVPFVQMVVFTVIFKHVAKLETPQDIPYAVFAYSGLVPWTFFQQSLTQATSSLTGNRGLVTKIYFPREVFPISKVLACLVDFCIAYTITFGLMLYYHMPLHATVLLMPIILVIQITFTLGIAFFLSVGNLFYRDVQHIIGVILRVWMFATAVIYPISVENPRVQAILNLNPMTPIINAYRDVTIYGQIPSISALWPSIAISIVLFACGWMFFHRVEFTFADNI